MNLAEAKQGMKINYIGESLGFGGTYTLIPAESTYQDANDCPEWEQGRLMIVEFTNDDTPMFILIDDLNPSDWRIVE